MIIYKSYVKTVLFLSLVLILTLNLSLFQVIEKNLDRSPKTSYTGDSKLEMVGWETQNMVVTQELVDDYSTVDINLNVGGTYNFSFKLSDSLNVPINNSIVWLHIRLYEPFL